MGGLGCLGQYSLIIANKGVEGEPAKQLRSGVLAAGFFVSTDLLAGRRYIVVRRCRTKRKKFGNECQGRRAGGMERRKMELSAVEGSAKPLVKSVNVVRVHKRGAASSLVDVNPRRAQAERAHSAQ